jgi:prepilin-type N-terminal cleavage/methylation domain-containing protein
MIILKENRTFSGFTLVEMAIVLAVVALLLGGLLPTISSQMEQAQRKETRSSLSEIQQALLGYAIIYGQLPCPTSITDPADEDYGISPDTCNVAPTTEGYLPWKTLGVSEVDGWGVKRNAETDLWIGYWRYRLDRNFSTQFNLSTGFADTLAIKDNALNYITTKTEPPVAIVFSTGKDLTENAENAVFNNTYQSDNPSTTFDDMLIWVSRPQLFNRMVSAGKLP